MRFREIPITIGVVGVVAFLVIDAFLVCNLVHRRERFWSPTVGITKNNAEGISAGMSENEVVGLLGVPYGQYYSGKKCVIYPFGFVGSTGETVTDQLRDDILCVTFFRDGELFEYRKGWVGQNISIWVTFDAQGKVRGKVTYPVSD
jgi:hypothetical protein